MTETAPRYAIYYAPEPPSPLWTFGCGVIGYDATSGLDVPFVDGMPFEQSRWVPATEEPRRYGFHATLKAPFHLRAGARESELLQSMLAIARRHRPFNLGTLEVSRIGNFVALMPVSPPPALAALEADAAVSLKV